MKFRRLGRLTLTWATVLTFIFQPGAFASAEEGRLDREKLQKAFKNSGFHHGPMKMGEFAELVANGLPADGAMLVRGLAQPVWNQPMPRVEISATPHLRMHIYTKKRIYTIEVVNSAKDFARINGEMISWQELVTPTEFIPHVLRMVEQKSLSEDLHSWLQFLIPEALASTGGDDDFYATGFSQNSQAGSPSGSTSAPVEPLAAASSSSPPLGGVAPIQPRITKSNESWFSKLGSTIGYGNLLTAATVAIGAWYVGNTMNKTKAPEQQVVIAPPPEQPRLPANMDEITGDTSRFKMVASALPQTSSDKVIHGTVVRESNTGNPTAIKVREKNNVSSKSLEPIF